MLESLDIRNFQKHRELHLEFDPEITVLSGRTNSGKSAILRCLHWLAFNRPSGDGFITHGQEQVQASLILDGGRSVVREKRKSKNVYLLDGKELAALGQGKVPEEVADLLNVDETNVQSQFAQVFWFSLTSGEVARELNKIVNLQLIDRVLSRGQAELKTARSRVQVSQERLDKARERLEGLEWVPQADKKLRQLEERLERVQELQSRVDRLEEALTEGRRLQDEGRVVSRHLEFCSKILERGARVLRMREEVRQLELLVGEGRRLERESGQSSGGLLLLERLLQQGEGILDLQGKIGRLEETCDQIAECDHEHEILAGSLRDMQKSLSRIKTCPLCERPIT